MKRIYQDLNPASQAFLIQMLALSLVIAVHFWATLNGLQPSILSLFVLQALIGITLSYGFSMAAWWHLIHGCFPLVVGIMLKYPIPPAYYFYGLLATSAVYWSTFRNQVPYFPSNGHVVASLKKLIVQQGPVRVMDIGSGMGGLMMQLAKFLPDSSFSGIEIAPLPWAVSVVKNKLSRSRAKFLYGDYRKLSFADYDVVYAYLSPVVMSAVWQKARAEMRPGSLLISNEFNIIDQPAHMTLPAHGQSTKLYVWRM